MQEFLQIALSFPTAIFSGLLIVVAFYWVSFVVGMVDIDLFDMDVDIETGGDIGADGFDADMDVDADVDMDVDAGADIGADVDADADFDADADVDADIDVDADSSGGIFHSIAAAMGLGTVPLTILVSFTVFFSWAISFLSVYYLGPIFGTDVLVGIGMALASAILALPITGVLVQPLKDVFRTRTRTAGQTIVGQVAEITTGSVNESFGQAKVDDGGAGLLISVRADTPNKLNRGSKALIIGYDADDNAYDIEPYDQFMGDDETVFDFADEEAQEQHEAKS